MRSYLERAYLGLLLLVALVFASASNTLTTGDRGSWQPTAPERVLEHLLEDAETCDRVGCAAFLAGQR
ncbi:MAG: hypothetical protein HOV79_00370 [Hamadaea sp.]|nr:hypothetical protein [Hamadaea sp.]